MKITSGLWDIINKVVTKKKKNGACVFLSTVFFLSLLAGKFAIIDRCYLQNKKKRRRRIISTRIFLSFLAGKIKIFEQPLIQPFRATKNCSWKSLTKSRNNISLHSSSDSPCFERNISILFCSSVKSCLSLLFDSRLKHQRYSPFILQEIENK